MTFDQIYRQHYVQIYKFCYRFVGESEKAGDLTQDTFMKLYLRMKSANNTIQNPRAWLYRVAGNNCLNASKTLKRRMEIMNDDNPERKESSNPETILLEQEQRQLLHQSLEELRPGHKMLVLMYADGLSYAEMAEATGIPLNSIGKTLWRSIEKISKTLKQSENVPGRTIS